jgi:hypothetical protein
MEKERKRTNLSAKQKLEFIEKLETGVCVTCICEECRCWDLTDILQHWTPFPLNLSIKSRICCVYLLRSFVAYVCVNEYISTICLAGNRYLMLVINKTTQQDALLEENNRTFSVYSVRSASYILQVFSM